MRFGKTYIIKKQHWTEVFPKTPRGVSLLSKLDREQKQSKAVEGLGMETQTPILVDEKGMRFIRKELESSKKIIKLHG